MTTTTAIILLFILTFSECNSKNIFKLIEDVSKDLDEVVLFGNQEVNMILDHDANSANYLHNNNKELFIQMYNIMDKIENYTEDIQKSGIFTLNKLNNFMESQNGKKELENILRYARRINYYYEELKSYKLHENVIERLTLEDFSKSVVSVDMSSVKSIMNEIYDLIVSDYISRQGLFKTIKIEMQNAQVMCDLEQSSNQVLYNAFSLVAATELKAFTLMQFSYKMLSVFGKGHFEEEVLRSSKSFKDVIHNIIQEAKSQLTDSATFFFKCDPKHHMSGVTYEKITKFLQGYIENEADLSSSGTCNSVCEDYSYTKSYSCFKNLYCRHQPKCNGRVIKCRFINAHMSVCPSSNPERRYDFIRFNNGDTFGNSDSCSSNLLPAESWTRWFVRCNYCFCICDDQGGNSNRFFNLVPYVSDVNENKVVVGMRFIKQNMIIHLQIMQGKLLPGGAIDPRTVDWVPIKDYHVTDRYVREGKEFFKLTWENRGIALSEKHTDVGFIVTGVKMNIIEGILELNIHETAFDFETGLLKPETSRWQILNAPFRSEYSVENSAIPPSSPVRKRSKVSTSNEFVKFTHTGATQDAAQTTVPFIDIQPVLPKYSVPLKGVGIYLKRLNYEGGFVAPQIFTYDYSSHLNDINFTTTVFMNNEMENGYEKVETN